MGDLDDDVTAWLLDTDPALRWQVERDLTGEPPAVWEATRARVATEGMGARLLALQDPDGQWAGGPFFPRDVRERDGLAPGETGQPWTATTWSLNSLREWGLDAAVLAGTAEKLEPVRWEYENMPFWGGEVDCCINAWTVANGLWLGADVSGIVDWFAEHRLDDGGWNCFWVDGSTRSSYHSTLNSLVALLAHERATGTVNEVRRAGEEYLLERHLVNRLSTGEPVGDWVDHHRYPFRALYTVLRALDHFRLASEVDGPRRDPRMATAVERLRAARRPDGRWTQYGREDGRVWFEVDVPAGEPSPWLTLYATRVLRWWDS